MEYDLLITGLKVTGVIVGSALGIAGVLFNFKSEDGRLTRSGLAVIIGILISSTIGVIGSVAEGQKAKLEAFEQTAQIHHLLSELDRSINPITRLDLTYWVILPNTVEIKRLINDTISFVNENREQLLEFRSAARFKDKVKITSTDINQDPLSVEIKPDSPFWANR